MMVAMSSLSNWPFVLYLVCSTLALHVCCPRNTNNAQRFSRGTALKVNLVSAKFSVFWSLTTPIRQRLVWKKAECVNSVFSNVWDAFPGSNLGSYHYIKMNSHTAALTVSCAHSALETEHGVRACSASTTEVNAQPSSDFPKMKRKW